MNDDQARFPFFLPPFSLDDMKQNSEIGYDDDYETCMLFFLRQSIRASLTPFTRNLQVNYYSKFHSSKIHVKFITSLSSFLLMIFVPFTYNF